MKSTKIGERRKEMARFLYQYIIQAGSGTYEFTLSKTTKGTPLTKGLWLPPCSKKYYVALSYDGTTYHGNIEINPGQEYNLSGSARKIKIIIP